MLIRFWGVRGSLPSPQLPSQIKSKISSILERLTPADLESPESRERFLSGLPPWLFGTVGGNTTCLSITVEDKPREIIVFDAGSGLRELGIFLSKEKPKPDHYYVFFSHVHWDHIMGLPFFNPAYDPSVSIDFYSPRTDLEKILRDQMVSPYFPVSMDSMGSKKDFNILEKSVTLDTVTVSYRKMNHPGDSYSYQVNDGKHRFIFATDTELSAEDFMKTAENSEYFQDADVIVMDCQYTLGEAIEKYNWGHSAFSLAVDFAANWGIKHMVMFHHDPTYNDRKLFNNLQSARWYTERMNIKGLQLSLAMEGLEIRL
ncbi:MAG: MBL fold metallo-hydrolase [Treponema sp.]|jgi:phosphoribosyl 1,2-cyclic phosphodiesterase|nr:MBL fold metallo-hydrolase [Treponema sp.]